MSNGWSLFIVFISLGSIAALGWLLVATSRANGKEDNETTGHIWDDDLQELNNPLPQWWLYLFIGTIIFSLVYLFWYPGLGNFKGMLNWTSTKQFEAEYAEMVDRQKLALEKFVGMDFAALTQQEAAMKTAGNLFANNCAVCHGSAAKGAPSFPNLTDDDWLYGGTPEQIRHTLVNGRNGMMPQLGLSEDSIEQLSHYVYGLSGNKVDSELAAKGKAQYGLCMGCHGADSKGNQALGAPNLTDKIWLYGDSLEAIQSVLREGRQGQMPAFSSQLTEVEIRLLTAYVTSLSKK